MSFPVNIWTGLIQGKHKVAMGQAIWVYLWLVGRVNQETNGIGVVLGGKSLSASEIGKELSTSERQVKRDIAALHNCKYITKVVTPLGIIVYVNKSKKFKRVGGQKCTPPLDKSGPSYKDLKDIKLKEDIPSESDFNKLWEIYPRKEGRKAALRYFLSSVRDRTLLAQITTALHNYLLWNDLENEDRSEAEKMKYTKMGKTWFGNWQDEKWQTPPEISRNTRQKL